MKKTLIQGFILAILTAGSFACKDDLIYTDLIQDRRPAVPVTFSNATTFGFNPFIEVSAASGQISYTLSIPGSTGRTIREITTVVGGGTGINPGTLNSAAAKFNTAPIPGSGTTATFTTTLAAFRAKYPTVVVTPSTNPLSPREIAFLFKVTLDDGTEIIPVQVRARIIP
jgi:hypothetical protein